MVSGYVLDEDQVENILYCSILIICPCFCSQQRKGDEPIPGCIGIAETGEDYCRPAEPTTPPIALPTSEVCILSRYYLLFLSIR